MHLSLLVLEYGCQDLSDDMSTPSAYWSLHVPAMVIITNESHGLLSLVIDVVFKSEDLSLTTKSSFTFQFCCDVSLYAVQTFLPAIIKGLGYTSVRANLMTVPVYLLGMVWFLFIAYMSDRTRKRGVWIGFPLLLMIAGEAILIAATKTQVRFFGCFVTILGIYPTVGLSIMWLSDNVGRHFKRASMVGLVLTIANTSGVAVGQIYRTQEAPRYVKGLTISLGLNVLALACIIGLMSGMWWVNRKRHEKLVAAEQAGTPLPEQPEKGDYDVHFVYSL
jgi:hypothetical protein